MSKSPLSFDLTGLIIAIDPVKTFPSGFYKRELVLDVADGQYSQSIKIEFLKDRADLLENFRAGQKVTIGVNLRGNEYEQRYFNAVLGWKITSAEESSPKKKQDSQQESHPLSAIQNNPETDDEIPF
jgi:hypothetical protein